MCLLLSHSHEHKKTVTTSLLQPCSEFQGARLERERPLLTHLSTCFHTVLLDRGSAGIVQLRNFASLGSSFFSIVQPWCSPLLGCGFSSTVQLRDTIFLGSALSRIVQHRIGELRRQNPLQRTKPAVPFILKWRSPLFLSPPLAPARRGRRLQKR
jgi:hypothetical protein